MVIAVENGLGDLTEKLREKGYTIVSYPEYAGVVDAFIYKDAMLNNIESYENNVVGESLENGIFSKAQGILIINASNKSVVDIEQILKTRVYSPLF